MVKMNLEEYKVEVIVIAKDIEDAIVKAKSGNFTFKGIIKW